jgi:hypothetical protein
MPETRHELAVGESVVIDDYLLTVEDIRGEEVLFRIERLPAPQFPGDGALPADDGWAADASRIPTEALPADSLVETQLDETDPPPGRGSPRSRPR